MLVAVIDWTNIIVSLIVGLPAIIAAVYAGRIHTQIRTPSGKSIGAVAEYTHDVSIANNMLLSQGNGPTKSATHATITEEGSTSPRIPTEAREEE